MKTKILILLSCAYLLASGCVLHVFHHVSFEHGGETVVIETDVGPLEFEPDVIVEISNGVDEHK